MNYEVEIRKNLDNIKSCTIPRSNWCPTCRDCYAMIGVLSHMAKKDQDKKGLPIRQAYDEANSGIDKIEIMQNELDRLTRNNVGVSENASTNENS